MRWLRNLGQGSSGGHYGRSDKKTVSGVNYKKHLIGAAQRGGKQFRACLSGLAMLASCAVLCIAVPAQAQGYPNRPIKLINPFPVGGSGDIIARVLSEKLKESLGQPVVVENRAGADGNIGAEVAARAAPDGYTLALVYSGTMAINPALYRKLPFDPIKDFAPISQISSTDVALVVNASLPVRTVREFIAYAKARPQPLAYGSGGTGNRMAAELFKVMAGVPLLYVPYKGSGPVMNDLIGGQVQVAFLPLVTAMPFIKSGKLRALGVTGTKALAAAPEVLPLAVSLPGYEYSAWFGVVAPANTPAEIVARLHLTVQQAFNASEVVQRFSGEGLEFVTSDSPAAFGAFIAADVRKWSKVVKDAGVQPN